MDPVYPIECPVILNFDKNIDKHDIKMPIFPHRRQPREQRKQQPSLWRCVLNGHRSEEDVLLQAQENWTLREYSAARGKPNPHFM